MALKHTKKKLSKGATVELPKLSALQIKSNKSVDSRASIESIKFQQQQKEKQADISKASMQLKKESKRVNSQALNKIKTKDMANIGGLGAGNFINNILSGVKSQLKSQKSTVTNRVENEARTPMNREITIELISEQLETDASMVSSPNEQSE